MGTFLIGAHIKKVIENNDVLKKAVGDNVYPLVAVEQTAGYPFIAFGFAGDVVEATKDGDSETISMNVAIVAKTHWDMLLIAEALRRALKKSTASYDDLGFQVMETTYGSISESYNPETDSYVMNVIFNFSTYEYE